MKQLGILLLATCAACGPGMRQPGSGGDGGNPGVDSGGGGGGGGGDSGGGGNSLVYAHSATVLYQVNTTSFVETEVGTFSGISGSVTDIAIDKNGGMVAITKNTLYSVDPATAKGTQISALASNVTDFTGLGYVPDPSAMSQDMLVTASSTGDVYAIDASGQGTLKGNFGKLNGKQIGSSGDIFGVRGFGTYSTVKVAGSTNDYLAEIDPSTWAATVKPMDTGFKNIFGLGFWAGAIYGFDDSGDVLQIDTTTGKATKMDNNSVVWWGAGVTTNAPVIQ